MDGLAERLQAPAAQAVVGGSLMDPLRYILPADDAEYQRALELRSLHTHSFSRLDGLCGSIGCVECHGRSYRLARCARAPVAQPATLLTARSRAQAVRGAPDAALPLEQRVCRTHAVAAGQVRASGLPDSWVIQPGPEPLHGPLQALLRLGAQQG